MDRSSCSGLKILLFKNIPREINDLAVLLNNLQIPAQHIKPFGRKRALITYESESEASLALDKLRHQEFAGKVPNISLFSKDKPEKKQTTATVSKPLGSKRYSKAVQTNTVTIVDSDSSYVPRQVNQFLQKLYATENQLSFNQPPPPYIKYRYPPINRDILDNISNALTNNKKFYTQVLHLMNRMHLEPPFQEKKNKSDTLCFPKDASTQTENVGMHNDMSESELESSEEMAKVDETQQISLKRKVAFKRELYNKKARQILHASQKLNKSSSKSHSIEHSIHGIFDTIIQTGKKPAIEVKIKTDISSNLLQQKPTSFSTNEKCRTSVDVSDFLASKISPIEIQELQIYKNYQRGEPSNKLYIKNLQKDVVSEDLLKLYKSLVSNNDVQLDVKVMQHGRMKGQAFVTFSSEHISPPNLQKIVCQVLDSTNGLIFRQKPMVVCFGKQTQTAPN